MSLFLSNEKAQLLINILKHIVNKHVIDFNNSPRGSIQLTSFKKHELTIHYNISKNVENKYSIHLMDDKTKHTLVRLNIGNNNTFHKNANGEIIYGNRINIFSEEEYKLKKDGYTHYKAYSLSHDTLIFRPTFIEMMDDFLQYTNTEKNDKLSIRSTGIQLKLF